MAGARRLARRPTLSNCSAVSVTPKIRSTSSPSLSPATIFSRFLKSACACACQRLGGGRRVLETLGSRASIHRTSQATVLLEHESLRIHPMPPWITKESHRPRVSHRTMSYRLAGRITVTLVSFQETDGAVTTVEMEPQAGRTLSPIHTTKRSNGFLRKTTRRSRVHVQTIGLNAETKKLRHRVDAAICLLTFPFIGLVR
jgi:hypothetical protein